MTPSDKRRVGGAGRDLIEIGDLAVMLAAHTDALAPELLSGARRFGSDWKCGSLDGEPGQSLHVWGRGSKRGEWHDFAAGEGGDLIDLVAAVRCGGDVGQAVRWAKAYLGLEQIDRRTLEVRRAAARATADKAKAQSEAELKAMRSRAHALWLEAKPIVGTPADFYLRGRGLHLGDLPRPPGSLRFHPDCYCKERGAGLPALVAAVAAPGFGFLSTHRVWLERRNGVWTKANLEHPRKVYCAMAGGWIEISRGASGRKTAQEQDGAVVAITEGIEDAIAVAMARPDLRVLAAVSLSNLAAVAATLPRAFSHVIIAADNDWQTPKAQEALSRAAARFRRNGRHVAVVMPQIGKDMNDWLRALAVDQQQQVGA